MVARRASEVTRHGAAVALACVVIGAGCREPSGMSASLGGSGSSDDGIPSSDEPLPDRVPPEPFVLPEGCGDGVPVSGQYDCHYPVSLEYLEQAMGARDDPTEFMAWDIDGDGRDELVAQAPGSSPAPKLVAPLRWNGERFDVGEPASSSVALLDWTTRFELDGDGRRDLVIFNGNGQLSEHILGPGLELADERIPAYFDVDLLGSVAPMDVDSDGSLEALAVRWPYTAENPYPPLELWLHRNEGGVWSPVGQALELPACRWAARFAWADFNGDGQEDVAVLDHPTACDDFPFDYEPSWHAISIFFREPLTQTLVPGPVIPVGGMTHEDLLMLEDFDDDGYLDFLVGLVAPDTYARIGVALVRGRGDGSFDEGVPIELPGIPEWALKGRGDLDGDGDVDWILRGDTVVDDIFAAEPEIVHVRSDVIGVDGEPWRSQTYAFGDFNGDGIIDYVGGWRVNEDVYRRVAMISAP
jgi:FG-GAP-like repeat